MINVSKSLRCMAGIALLAGTAVVHAQDRPPLSAYGSLPAVEDMDLSQDGKHVASLTRVGGKRACIVGASYGGYAALAGVTLQQGLYRCAVSVAGIGDVSRMFRVENSQSGNWSFFKRSLLEELGPRSGFDDISPRRFAARADAPAALK